MNAKMKYIQKPMILLVALALLGGLPACRNEPWGAAGDFPSPKSYFEELGIHSPGPGADAAGIAATSITSGGFSIASVDGARATEEDPLAYSGQPMTFVFSYSISVTPDDADFNTLFLCFLDGVLCPFTVGEETAPRESYVQYISGGGTWGFTFTLDPKELSFSETSRLRFVAVGNFDTRADTAFNIWPITWESWVSFDLCPAEGLAPIAPPDPQPVLSVPDAADGRLVDQDVLSEEANLGGGFNRIYVEGAMEVGGFYMTFSRSGALRMMASLPAGRYRSSVFVEGGLVPAFSGLPYLDWESPAESAGMGNGTVLDIQLDSGVLPEDGLCNIFAVHIPMDDFPDPLTSLIAMMSGDAVTPILTLDIVP